MRGRLAGLAVIVLAALFAPDCRPPCNCDATCDYCWCNTESERSCPDAWYGTGDGCDCGCQWTDPDCAGGGNTCPAGFPEFCPAYDYCCPSSSSGCCANINCGCCDPSQGCCDANGCCTSC